MTNESELKWEFDTDAIVWKSPCTEIPTNLRLTVSQGQEAVVITKNLAVGPFGVGQHLFNTEDYSELKPLIQWDATGKSFIPAEVWFIKRPCWMCVKWGTKLRMGDFAETVQVFGEFAFKVEDSVRFIMKLRGELLAFDKETVGAYFKDRLLTQMNSLLSRFRGSRNVQLAQLNKRKREIASFIKTEFSKNLADYGVMILEFSIAGISIGKKATRRKWSIMKKVACIIGVTVLAIIICAAISDDDDSVTYVAQEPRNSQPTIEDVLNHPDMAAAIKLISSAAQAEWPEWQAREQQRRQREIEEQKRKARRQQIWAEEMIRQKAREYYESTGHTAMPDSFYYW